MERAKEFTEVREFLSNIKLQQYYDKFIEEI
jgi:hypothetical protein